MSRKKHRLIKWLGKKFQLVLYHSKSYDIIRKYKFNRFGFLMLSLLIFLLYFSGISALVVFTPLKQFIPGYPDKETRILIYENAIRTDSLIKELEIRDQYLGFMRDVLFNDIPIDEEYVTTVSKLSDEEIESFNDPRTLRSGEIREKQKLVTKQSEVLPYFFSPIKGVVTSGFNPAIKHFGTDIATADQETIHAVSSGTVIIADYTIETGYMIVIQHQSNILSVYRHAKALLVNTGDFVITGQAIALYGNTGELSSGKHLHFELWKNGKALNPENYIDF